MVRKLHYLTREQSTTTIVDRGLKSESDMEEILNRSDFVVAVGVLRHDELHHGGIMPLVRYILKTDPRFILLNFNKTHRRHLGKDVPVLLMDVIYMSVPGNGNLADPLRRRILTSHHILATKDGGQTVELESALSDFLAKNAISELCQARNDTLGLLRKEHFLLDLDIKHPAGESGRKHKAVSFPVQETMSGRMVVVGDLAGVDPTTVNMLFTRFINEGAESVEFLCHL